MKKSLAILFILLVTAAVRADDRLPLAAGLCVSRAQRLAEKGDIKAAASVLEAFIARRNPAGKDEIRQKRDAHYYLFFMLGNYYSLLAQSGGIAGEEAEAGFLRGRAAENYENAVRIHPSFFEAWLNLATNLYESDRFGDAARAFLKAYDTAESPRADHLYYAAVSHFQAGAYERALSVFERIQAVHPDRMSLEWKETLVNVYFSLDRNRDALPVIEILAAQPAEKKKKQWQEVLLYQYQFLGMTDRAMDYAGFLTRTDTLEPKWWKALCHIYLENHQWEQGLTALIISGFLAPWTSDERLLAADLYLSCDIPGKAADLYRTVLADASLEKKAETVLKMAGALLMAHEPVRALAAVENGVSVSGDERLLRIEAQILDNIRAYERAMAVFEALSHPADDQAGPK